MADCSVAPRSPTLLPNAMATFTELLSPWALVLGPSLGPGPSLVPRPGSMPNAPRTQDYGRTTDHGRTTDEEPGTKDPATPSTDAGAQRRRARPGWCGGRGGPRHRPRPVRTGARVPATRRE